MSDVKITVNENGPYIINGQVTYVDADGNEQTTKGKAVALCRCGLSENKPFCDGSHRESFEGAKIELVLLPQE